MQYQLSDSTIRLIKEQNVTQKELAKRIVELYEEGKVARTISQQSISRYVNGILFPYKDTENIILTALSSLLGSRRFRAHRKLYKLEQDKNEEKQKKLKIKKHESIRNSELSLSLRTIMNNKVLQAMIPSDEEIEYYEEQRNRCEQRQVLDFWRSAPNEIKEYWLEVLGVLEEFPRFLRETLYAMAGISQEDLKELITENYLSYCSDNVYSRYSNEFSDKQLLLLSRLMLGASRSNEKVYEFISKSSDIYKVVTTGEYDWVPSYDSSYLPENDAEQRFFEFYTKSGMQYNEFIYLASLCLCMEKVDWLMLHSAYIFSKTQTGRKNILWANYFWVTRDEEEFLERLRACQHFSKHTERK